MNKQTTTDNIHYRASYSLGNESGDGEIHGRVKRGEDEIEIKEPIVGPTVRKSDEIDDGDSLTEYGGPVGTGNHEKVVDYVFIWRGTAHQRGRGAPILIK